MPSINWVNRIKLKLKMKNLTFICLWVAYLGYLETSEKDFDNTVCGYLKADEKGGRNKNLTGGIGNRRQKGYWYLQMD